MMLRRLLLVRTTIPLNELEDAVFILFTRNKECSLDTLWLSDQISEMLTFAGKST